MAFIAGLCAATDGGWALGDARFKRQIADALLRKGRRPTPHYDARQIDLL